MKILSIYDMQMTDLDGLELFEELIVFNISKNCITDISNIKHLKKLRYLSCDHNLISDISPVAENKDMLYLNIESNFIEDCSAVRNMQNLTTLNIRNTMIKNIMFLPELYKLRYFLYSDKFIDEQVLYSILSGMKLYKVNNRTDYIPMLKQKIFSRKVDKLLNK